MSKKKKDKVIYIDDGSTIADMSEIGGKKSSTNNYLPPKRKASLAEQWQTYKRAVQSMFVPMVVVLSVMVLIYVSLMLIL